MSDFECSVSEQDQLLPTEKSHQDATPAWASTPVTLLTTAVASASLAACGGGSDSPDNNVSKPSDTGGGGTPAVPASEAYITNSSRPGQLDAWRFLNQATFGPTLSDLSAVASKGYVAWLNEQFTATQDPAKKLYPMTKYSYENKNSDKLGPLFADPSDPDVDKHDGLIDRTHVSASWWEKVLTGKDQLRQRVAYTLSQILVISMQRGGIGDAPYACANYYDLLLDNAFGNFADLLTQVAAHPAMAVYLSSMSNQKPDGNRIPDQNFAREIMQLFSIGLYELNMDGTLKKGADGQPIETYKPYDIEVLSHVFTGWGWQHAFESYVIREWHESAQISPMKAYPEHHSAWEHFPKKDAAGKVVRFPDAKAGTITLLGKPLAISESPDPEADRQAALDIILAHPNVAPFIAKQMIQLMVTSNPSPEYVGRAAKAFKDTGLNLMELVKAILLDKDARDVAAARSNPTYGRLREPLLRVTQFMRAFEAKSVGNRFHVSSLAGVSGHSIAELLGQSPLESPSVFNFYRPGYMAPNSKMAAKGLVTPEMQISSETEVAAYMRFMDAASLVGFGKWVKKDGTEVGADDYSHAERWSPLLSVYADYKKEITLSVDASQSAEQRKGQLLDLLSAKLFGGAMSASLKAHLGTLADKFSYTDTNASTFSEAHFRVGTLAYAAAVSPEFVVQR